MVLAECDTDDAFEQIADKVDPLARLLRKARLQLDTTTHDLETFAREGLRHDGPSGRQLAAARPANDGEV